jgi:hypothetical protein
VGRSGERNAAGCGLLSSMPGHSSQRLRTSPPAACSDVRPPADEWQPQQPSPVSATGDGIERRLTLQVSAHQSGSLITTESSRRWPAALWPAEIGAPRRSRTYNPLAASRMISPARTFASVLARSGVPPRRSCAVVADVGRFVAVSGDQSGNLIMHLVNAAVALRDLEHAPLVGDRGFPGCRCRTSAASPRAALSRRRGSRRG